MFLSLTLLRSPLGCSWDEWVDTKRLLKFTDANVTKQKKVHREAAEKRGKSKQGGPERKGVILFPPPFKSLPFATPGNGLCVRS